MTEERKLLPAGYHQSNPDSTPSTSDEAASREDDCELDLDQEMTDEYPEFLGEPADIEMHHLPGIQAILGPQFDLHPCSSFPSNRTEIEMAAAALQSSETLNPSPESQARTRFSAGGGCPSSAEVGRREWSRTRVLRHDRSSGFRRTIPRDKKRRRLNDRDRFVVTKADQSDK